MRIVTRLTLTLVSFCALAIPSADAEQRAPSAQLTCDAATNLVRRVGAVIFDTGNGTYDRYVSDARYCQLGEITAPAYVPTRDQRQCVVGNTCISRYRNSSK